MPLPFALAFIAAAAAGGYHHFQRNEQARRRREGRAFRLPTCCEQVLNRAHHFGTIAGAIGVTVSTAKLVGDISPVNLPFLVTADWPAEGQLHTEFAQGLQALASTGLLETVFAHYQVHVLEDSDVQRFWAGVCARVIKRQAGKSNYGRALEIFTQDDAQFRPPAQR